MNKILSEYRKLQLLRTLPDNIPFVTLTLLVLCFFGGVLFDVWLFLSFAAVFLVLGIYLSNTTALEQDQYSYLQNLVRKNQDALLALLLSGELNDRDSLELAFLGADYVSVKKEDNLEWAGFTARLRRYKDRLPVALVKKLNWLEKVQGW